MNPDFELLIAVLAALAIALWMYGDASDRNLRTAVYWGVAGFLFGLVGFIAYFLWVMRPNLRGKKSK